MAKTSSSHPIRVSTAVVADIRARMLRWYDEEHRPLPWRTAPSDYGTVVSEFMLQQTQVATVLPYYLAFLERFPSFDALARAPEQEVLRYWSGLGYYRRARLLKRAAETIMRAHGGALPRDPDALADLPGFGEYTVGAVGSIALGLPLPLVDGNVRRVIGRFFALDQDLTRGPGRKLLWDLAALLVDRDRPGDFNQALMELGATVCLPREPLCLVCPLFDHCRARARGMQEDYPAPVVRPTTLHVQEVAVALFRHGKVLLLQRGETSAFAGMWELPRLDSRDVLAQVDLTPEMVLFELLRVRTAAAAVALGRAESVFTHHRIETTLYRIEAPGEQPIRRQRHVTHKWLAPRSLGELPTSRAQRRLFALLKAK